MYVIDNDLITIERVDRVVGGWAQGPAVAGLCRPRVVNVAHAGLPDGCA